MQRSAHDRSVVRTWTWPAWTPVVASLLGLLVALVAAASIGSVPVAPADVLGAVARGLTGSDAGPLDTIVWRIRVPRVLLAGLVGAALALAGVGFQGIFRNPLADPYLLGAASGAGFGATLVLALGAGWPLLRAVGAPTAAFAAGLATVATVVALARQGGRLPVVNLVLAGVVLGSCLSAATSFVLLASREQTAGILSWLLGSFAFASWERLAAALPAVVLAGAVVLLSHRALDVLQLGEEEAAHLGLSVERFKALLVAAATLATAAAVSVAGVIGFVGLVTPHAVRLAFGPRHALLAPLAALWGAGFMVLADLAARTVLAPAEVPVGIVTALVGAPFFLALLRRRRA